MENISKRQIHFGLRLQGWFSAYSDCIETDLSGCWGRITLIFITQSEN